MTGTEAKVVAAWHQAAADLGVKFTSPFTVTLEDGSVEFIGLVHKFGRRLGTLISVLGEPSEETRLRPHNDYFQSILGSVYAGYKRQLFIDTLDDWQFFGSETERPGWYSGKSWS
jgi:hypothetical protein